MKNKAFILKVALFATGLSGIVAEYILATLASYFLGDSIVQWALIISLMLFFMGVGSRITQYIKKNIFTTFIFIEFTLSLFVSFSALLAYSTAAFSIYAGVMIYFMSMVTGLLIGMELPLAVRLNESFEELRVNISSILEKDYYGSLLGGLFFAFVGLPYLGLTYSPFLLGFVNLAVAIAMLNLFPTILKTKTRIRINIVAALVLAIILTGTFNARQIIFFGEQNKYKDKVIYSAQTRYQKIVITEWRNDHWLYLNGNLQLSTYDEALYHEVLVHPAMALSKTPAQILILGGGDGCAAREILKYPGVKNITLVDLDPAMTDLAKTHPVLVEANDSALFHPKLKIINLDGYKFLEDTRQYFDLIIIDLPDPRNVELSRLYSREFYTMCRKQLRLHGVLITQAGSPYYAAESFRCILKTIEAAGFSAIPLHNQILTMGEWGWVLGVNDSIPDEQIKSELFLASFDRVETRWMNNEAMYLITSFGKDFFIDPNDSIKINKIHDPVLYRYFLKGSWDLY
ncbi:MAG: polyamine aminopropyltransferase [Bacteroidales bacterium]|nr:polyamine aminopropyltransferase [Bacteroidales bacterium]